MPAGVVITSKYGLKKIDRLLHMKKETYVRVGVMPGTGEHPNADPNRSSNPSIAQVAFWNEFGTILIPERPFLRDTIRENYYYRAHLIRALKDALILPGDPDLRLKRVGQIAARDIRRKITSNNYVPNSPATIKRKSLGGRIKDKPLIDTGALRQAIQSMMEKDM